MGTSDYGRLKLAQISSYKDKPGLDKSNFYPRPRRATAFLCKKFSCVKKIHADDRCAALLRNFNGFRDLSYGTKIAYHSVMNRTFMLLLVIPLIFGGCNAVDKSLGKSKSKVVSYEYTAIKRGTIEKTVSSSGSLEPVATVKVLPRMSGKVEKIFVDYNDPVKKGQVLAELNTDMLKLQREQQASQVLKARANYSLQQINFANLQKLAEKNLISEYELTSGQTALNIQKADLSVAEANLRSIETEINQYAYITSPIDGTVLERAVNEGDTVVDSSSSNSKAIFTLAENLE